MAAVLAGLVFLRGDAQTAAGGRPNVLLVTLDTARADHCSAYGYYRPTTPRLEALLPSSVRFAAAYAPMATTLPTHATIFTGLLPRAHGVLKNGLVLGDDAVTLAEVLREDAYRTAAFVSSFVLSSRFGTAQGFEHYGDSFEGSTCKSEKPPRWEDGEIEHEFCRQGNETTAVAAAWLADNGYLGGAAGRARRPPFFVWAHYFDPHAPYDAPAEHAALFPPLTASPSRLTRAIAAYDAEIHFADQQVGRLLDRLAAARLLDDTLVIVTADHGEGLMQHGWMNHGFQIYEEAVHVPLIVRWPARIGGGRTVPSPVGVVDLPATVLDLVGASHPEASTGFSRDGQSLAAVLLEDEAHDPLRPVFLERRLYENGRTRGRRVAGLKLGVRSGRWKYIEAKEEGTRELYDLILDPSERENVVAENPAEAERLAATVAAWVDTSPRVAPGAEHKVADEDARKLRALGYTE